MASKIVLESVTAAKLRQQRFTVAFFGGRVHIWKPGHPAMGQKIDGGKWMNCPGGWEAEGRDVEERMKRHRAECYCGCGVRACDFCQGVRAFPA